MGARANINNNSIVYFWVVEKVEVWPHEWMEIQVVLASQELIRWRYSTFCTRGDISGVNLKSVTTAVLVVVRDEAMHVDGV